ncbi:HD-GYP domain-containing protein [Paenibacillus sp. OAS669]|uniref:HD-GYP domain-containing protein n=1 Tax=Paenibacillus sp. OAS669 TaxID=2663821 RepID=UPI00178909F5|nr:HD-GYP domain-containing protein [Paenibacillus sp. OAS669]MBE1444889.1 HD-GYP domain-containing protein (c-di-GMP phosphodiesterase class II) [Paenibacillus sp. OAS669]
MEHLIGKQVKHDIINAYGATVLPARTIIDHEALTVLSNHRIPPEHIAVADPALSEEDGEAAALMEQTVAVSKELIVSIKRSRKIPVIEIRKEILPAIRQIAARDNLFQLFELVKAKDDYTYQHNIGVGVLSTLIGRWMNLSEPELANLSLAATLHDIGKVKIPDEILNKPGKLTDDEYELVKKHTIFGYEMLRDTRGISHRIALVALQHHEREDGRGYPFGLQKSKIDLLSSIVAVADIFHAMSSKRPYHEPLPFYEIVSQMQRGKFGELDPKIISLFVDNMIRRLVGKQVVLTDGRVAEVVYLNPHHMEAPLVKIEEEFIDLSRESSLQIREILAW